MNGGELDAILQRIDGAIGRIDAALGKAAGVSARDAAALQADNARLRGVVSEAIMALDGLLAAAQDDAAGRTSR